MGWARAESDEGVLSCKQTRGIEARNVRYGWVVAYCIPTPWLGRQFEGGARLPEAFLVRKALPWTTGGPVIYMTGLHRIPTG